MFGIKFTSFGNRSDVVYIWSLACPVIKCTSFAHESISVLQGNKLFFFGRFYFSCCKPKWRSVNNYTIPQRQVKGYTFGSSELKLAGMWTALFESLNVTSVTYLLTRTRLDMKVFKSTQYQYQPCMEKHKIWYLDQVGNRYDQKRFLHLYPKRKKKTKQKSIADHHWQKHEW